MSEIQWILSLVLNHSLPEEVKKACLERIGEVESRMRQSHPIIGPSSPQAIGPQQMVGGRPISHAQAMDQGELMSPIPQAPVPSVAPPLSQKPLTHNLGEIITGGGSMTSIRGPNKMRGRL